MSAASVGGKGQSARVEVFKDGRISYPQSKTFPSGGEDLSPTATPSACNDSAYSLTGLSWYGKPYKWYIGDGSFPAALSRSAAANAFADAINNITRSTNDCGLADQVSAERDYQGTTTFESDISSSGTCTEPDGKSTWDAAKLDPNALATTCIFWTAAPPGQPQDLAVEADVRFNIADFDFSNNASTCTTQFDLRAVATHESGHVFGLDHVSTGHENLTMFHSGGTCDSDPRTLGKGDVLGLRSLY
ncbi:matrixin family metalloprotease [Streptomyces smyrnaeus]|uniref:matrixin family metalloprotease n=1 Tax=Streptomyces smyrnaeus TaxID=1387713 RepID=UPI0033E32769